VHVGEEGRQQQGDHRRSENDQHDQGAKLPRQGRTAPPGGRQALSTDGATSALP
jgi:hypothetical protein